ncbi:glycoside hydrolase family 3 protein, partial [Candidatus Woesebacteria bacterium]|nr:glycoside hydrolase family 3 protein [Candidatus Woesebacteria bacterium]
MNTKSSGLIIVLAVIAAVLGWRYFTRPTYIGPQPTIPSVEPTATPTPAPQHTKEELGKLLMLPLTVTASKTGIATSAATLQYLKTYSPGFVLFFGDAISTQSASAARQTLLAHTNHIPALAVDHEGGSVQRLSGLGFTKLPSFRDVCKLPTEERRALFSQSAQELQAAGVTVALGPVIDVAVDNSVLTDRICSKDKGVVTAVAQEFITEFQKRGITPVLKHYPGIGGTTKDLHKSIDAITESPAEISIYQSLLRIYPSIGVMVAHV